MSFYTACGTFKISDFKLNSIMKKTIGIYQRKDVLCGDILIVIICVEPYLLKPVNLNSAGGGTGGGTIPISRVRWYMPFLNSII